MTTLEYRDGLMLVPRVRLLKPEQCDPRHGLRALRVPSFARARSRWNLTVELDIDKITPISQSVLPAATQRRHSSSRALSSLWPR